LNITEVRVKLMHHRSDRLRAFCSITIDDDFVVHDLRVIEGRKGYFVAMPSRKLSTGCPRCSAKNPIRAKFCSDCGARLPEEQDASAEQAHDKLHVDVAHPINTACREMLQEEVLVAYREELERSSEEGGSPDNAHIDDLDDLADEYGDLDIADEDEKTEPDEPAFIPSFAESAVAEPLIEELAFEDELPVVDEPMTAEEPQPELVEPVE